MHPLVSVVVPAYGQPAYLRQALASVACQELEHDFEVVVVDDGSPCDLRAAAEGAGLGERLVFLTQENRGGAAARNAGIARARGELVAFLDHDDVWTPRALQVRVARLLSDPGVDLVFCRYRRTDEDGGSVVVPDAAPSRLGLAELLERTYIRTLSAVVARRRVVAGADGFREDLRVCNDLELYYRVAEHGGVGFEPEVLVEWRRHGSNVSRDRLQMHVEAVAVVDELLARIGDGAAPRLHKLARARLRHHLLRAAAALREHGEPVRALAHDARALRLAPWHARSWAAAGRDLLAGLAGRLRRWPG